MHTRRSLLGLITLPLLADEPFTAKDKFNVMMRCLLELNSVTIPENSEMRLKVMVSKEDYTMYIELLDSNNEEIIYPQFLLFPRYENSISLEKFYDMFMNGEYAPVNAKLNLMRIAE